MYDLVELCCNPARYISVSRMREGDFRFPLKIKYCVLKCSMEIVIAPSSCYEFYNVVDNCRVC